MNRYRFLIGWIEDSDSAGGEKTGIKFEQGRVRGLTAANPSVSVFVYELPSHFEEWAWHVGAGYAFSENFTGHDTVSKVQKFTRGRWKDFA